MTWIAAPVVIVLLALAFALWFIRPDPACVRIGTGTWWEKAGYHMVPDTSCPHGNRWAKNS